MLRAALLDVGGTLWPNALPAFGEPDPRLASLRLALPELDAGEAFAVLTTALREEHRITQDTHAAIAAALRQMGAHDVDAMAVRRALCVPASAGLQMFRGTTNLLVHLRAL